MNSHFNNIIKNDLRVTFRKKGNLINLIIFFLLVISLFPIGIGSDSEILGSIGVGVIWVAALLSSTISIPYIFEEDYETGILEQFIIQPVLPHILAVAKAISHWLTTGLLIIILTPALILMFEENTDSALFLAISLLLGTISFSFIGTISASLTLGLKRGSVIASLIAVPLYIPTLIFGTGVVQSKSFGLMSEQSLTNISGLLLILLILIPLAMWSASLSLRIALEE